MTETTAQTESADKYWDYLMNADESPRSFLFVAVPVLLALAIVSFILILRRLRKTREAEWLKEEDTSGG